jgi:hypothetical protein
MLLCESCVTAAARFLGLRDTSESDVEIVFERDCADDLVRVVPRRTRRSPSSRRVRGSPTR